MDKDLWVSCTRCPHGKSLTADDLVRTPGLDTLWSDFLDRLLCTKCGGRAMVNVVPRKHMDPPAPAPKPPPGGWNSIKPSISDWERRHSRRKGWHRKYLDESGNPTNYRKDD